MILFFELNLNKIDDEHHIALTTEPSLDFFKIMQRNDQARLYSFCLSLMIKLQIIKKQLAKMDTKDKLIQILKVGLYSIEPVVDKIDKKLMSLAYTPGVGTVCLDIQQNEELSNQMTLRARAIAIVSDGSLLNSEGKSFMPVMDWFVFQIKHYTGLDAFPFVVRKQIDLASLLRDLSTTYGTVLYLDRKQISDIPKNILFVRHQTILDIHKCEKTNANYTSTALAYWVAKKTKGEPCYQDYRTANVAPYFKKNTNYKLFVEKTADIKENSRDFHRHYEGKIKIAINNDFSMPQLLQCFTQQNLSQIVKLPSIYSKTSQLASIVTDGTAILGFGNIGPSAGLPVMQGKCLLFKFLGQVDVIPFCMYPRKSPKDEIDAIINTVGNFLAVNLQDIKAPQCFEIENSLKNMKLLPVFHDDQHGTAIVVLAALINALKVVQKSINSVHIIINGAGAAGITIAKLLVSYGAKNVVVCDTKGAIYKGRVQGMNQTKNQIAQKTNFYGLKGNLETVIQGADVFIGVSAAGALKGKWIKKMNQKSIIFALANPIPEIFPDEAKQNGAFIYGSGRVDFQNQINNSLAFPGIFRSIKEHHLKEITQEMNLKAALALSKCIDRAPNRQYVIPESLDKHLSVVISNQIGGISN